MHDQLETLASQFSTGQLRCSHSVRSRFANRSQLIAMLAALIAFLATTSSALADARTTSSATSHNIRAGNSVAPRPAQLRTPDSAAGRRIPKPSATLVPSHSKNGSSSGSTNSIYKTLAALLLVVTLILLGAKFLRKHSPALKLGLPKDAVEVLGRTSLDPRQHVYLVRLGAQILVLGSSAGELRTLANITDPLQVDLLAGSCKQQSGQHQPHGLVDLFRRFTAPSATQVQPPPSSDPTPSPESDFHRRLQDRFTVPAASSHSTD